MDLLDLVVRVWADDQASSQIESISSGIRGKLGGAVGTVGKAAAAGVAAAGAAATAFGASAVSAGMDFDAAMSQVAATMGTTTDKITELRDFAQEMGATTAFSATQSAEALNYMALAGYDAETSMNMLPTVLNLAAAGGMELADASDMVTDAQSALGLSIEETSAMVDQMARASSKTNTSVAQLGSAFLTVGGTARDLSGGTVELASALGILADNGIKGAEGGTALRNILLGIQDDKFEKTFGAMGVSAYDADGNLRPLNETLADMSAVMEGMTTAERTDLIANTFNRYDLKSINALLGTTAERWDEVTSAISDADGAASAMAETQLDNLQGDITLFKSALEGFQIAVSDGITPTMRDFVQIAGDGLGQITQAFREGGLEGALGAFQEVLTSLLAKVIEILPQIVETASQLLSSFVQAIVSNAPALVGAAVQIITTLADFIVQNVPLLLGAAMQIIAQLIVGIAQALPSLLSSVIELVTQISTTILDNLPIIMEAAIQLFMALVQALPVILPQLISAIVTLVGSIANYMAMMAPTVLGGAIQLFMAIVQAVPQIIGALIGAIGGLIGQAAGAIAGGAGQLLAAGIQMFQGFLSGIQQKASEIFSFVASIPGRIVEALSNIGASLFDAGANIINGFLDGLKSAFTGVQEFVGGIGEWIVNNKGPEDYDKRLLVNAGQLIMGGLANGLESGMDDVRGAIEDVNGLFGEVNPTIDADYQGTSKYQAPSIVIKDCVFNVRDDEDIDAIGNAIAARTATVSRGRLG